MEEKLDRIIELLEQIVENTKKPEARLNFSQVLIKHTDDEAVARTVSEASNRDDVESVRYRPRP